MTLPVGTNRSGPYIANGVTTIFARTFFALKAEHIQVYQTIGSDTNLITSGLTFDGLGSSSGNVTFNEAPISGSEITILRKVPVSQETDYSAQGRVNPEQIESDLDYAMMIMADISERLDRSLKLPENATPDDIQVPEPLAGQILIGKQDGTGWENALYQLADILTYLQGRLPYDIRVVAAGALAPDQVIDTIPLAREITFDANFAGSFGVVGIAPASTFTISIRNGATPIGTVTIDTSKNFVFSTIDGQPKTLPAGTVLVALAQETHDINIQNISLVLRGSG